MNKFLIKLPLQLCVFEKRNHILSPTTKYYKERQFDLMTFYCVLLNIFVFFKSQLYLFHKGTEGQINKEM